jgi:hypothetical protein
MVVYVCPADLSHLVAKLALMRRIEESKEPKCCGDILFALRFRPQEALVGLLHFADNLNAANSIDGK